MVKYRIGETVKIDQAEKIRPGETAKIIGSYLNAMAEPIIVVKFENGHIAEFPKKGVSKVGRGEK